MPRQGTARPSPLRRLLSFPRLRTGKGAAGAAPTEGELLFELAGQNPENRLFGRDGADQVKARLARAGLLDGLARRGYPDPLLVLECADPADQRIYLFDGRPARGRILLEARLELSFFHPGAPIGPFTGEESFRMLIIHWLLLSDPERTFTAGRPRLPGQERPGLGLLPECLALLNDLSRDLLLDGVLDVPDHYHTALFYSRRFHYLDAAAEGRLKAIARDLRGVPLALASEAIALGCLVEAATGGRLPWRPAEQILAARGPLRRYFRSREYALDRDRVCRGLRVTIDWDRYRAEIASLGRAGNYP